MSKNDGARRFAAAQCRSRHVRVRRNSSRKGDNCAWTGSRNPPAPVRAPILEFADLKALESTLVAVDQGNISPIESGSLETVGSFPRVFPVRGAVAFATGFRWNNR